jgi:hypothetical protein
MINSSPRALARAADDRLQGARNIGVLDGVKTIRDSVGLKDKNDYYSFTLGGRSQFNLSLDKLQDDVDVSLIQNGRVLFDSRKRGRKPEAIAATLEGGTYNVRVYPKKGQSKYRLKLSSSKLDPITPAAPQLGSGRWLLTGNDVAGNSWNGSTITFESQTDQGGNYSLSGYFNWVGSNGAYGRENFTGTLFANNKLQLIGTEIVNPAFGIVTSNYNADLAPGEKNIVNGSWDSNNAIPSYAWSAAQVVA